MGSFSKFLKGFVDPRASGESIIEKQEEVYLYLQKTNPDAEPHQLLIDVYLSRMRTHGKNPQSAEMKMEALLATKDYACLPFPGNVRALGIGIIRFERPDIIERCEQFESDYSILMIPVRTAHLEDQFGLLYEKLNPKMAEMLKEFGR